MMLSFVLLLLLQVSAVAGTDVQARVDQDLVDSKPIVAHVVVVLCDNRNQGIVPVPASLGDGQNPRTNLYWGAAYGLKTYFRRHDRYKLESSEWTTEPGVLDKAVFSSEVVRNGEKVQFFVVAEAWDGKQMGSAISYFLRLAVGHGSTEVKVSGHDVLLQAGGDASVVAFVGHNGLMDFSVQNAPDPRSGAQPRSSIVLACASKPYFLDLLRVGGSHPMLLTTGLMAPEAYSLEAALSSFAAGADPERVREAAASSYDRFQKCGKRGAMNLFSYQP